MNQSKIYYPLKIHMKAHVHAVSYLVHLKVLSNCTTIQPGLRLHGPLSTGFIRYKPCPPGLSVSEDMSLIWVYIVASVRGG